MKEVLQVLDKDRYDIHEYRNPPMFKRVQAIFHGQSVVLAGIQVNTWRHVSLKLYECMQHALQCG